MEARRETERERPITPKTAYEKWQEGEAIPILNAFCIDDVLKVGLEPWERVGGMGAFLNMAGSENTNGAYLCEVSPGKALKPQRHLYEEMIYVLSGRGGAMVWREEGKKLTFEWQAGSLFSPPLNTWFELFNGSGTEPARFLAVTTAPLAMNLFHNIDFVFGCDYAFTDRFNGKEDYFSERKDPVRGYFWETNFVSNIRAFEPRGAREATGREERRGVGIRRAIFEMAGNVLCAHISEWQPGTYKKAHRHGPGANILILAGQGYSLLWQEGRPRQRIDWRPGGLFVPPPQWFHQHFNASPIPVRFVALRWSNKFSLGGVFGYEGFNRDVKEGGNQIEWEDQDPEIHRLYVQECAEKGVSVSPELQLIFDPRSRR